MTQPNSADYYKSRAEQERSRASDAPDPAVAAVHREMAARYAELVIHSDRTKQP